MDDLKSLLDAVVKSVTDVGEKARILVEVSSIQAQIYTLQKEIEATYCVIGQLVYTRMTEAEESVSNMGQTDVLVTWIKVKNQEIAELNDRIMALNGEKQCKNCAKTIAIGAKYCSDCGHEHPVEEQTDCSGYDEIKICSNCGEELAELVKFCGNCGQAVELTDETDETDRVEVTE